uniref:Uncharacterized protein n=1 Tax=Anguilla anguilla TaxID=7936 RepID=A0A0E9SIJ3_ANGAN
MADKNTVIIYQQFVSTTIKQSTVMWLVHKEVFSKTYKKNIQVA